MAYVNFKNGGFRWVDPSENYELKDGETFTDSPPETVVTPVVETVAADPVTKLKDFLAANPDVAGVLK
jgi:hypothetical protein